MRFIFRHCGVLICTPHSSRFARLASGAFYKPVGNLTFYERIKFRTTKFPQSALGWAGGSFFEKRKRGCTMPILRSVLGVLCIRASPFIRCETGILYFTPALSEPTHTLKGEKSVGQAQVRYYDHRSFPYLSRMAH